MAKVALITGGAKRVGAAIVRRMAAAGFDVAFTYRSSTTAAQALCAEIRQNTGRNALAIAADFTDPPAAVTAIAAAMASMGPSLDLLVNSASIFKPARLAATDPALLQLMMDVHVTTPALLCRHFADALRTGRGCVVNMVDLLAEKPFPDYLAYSASKAALVNLTQSLARELAPQVTVNAIAPGVVDWPDDYPQQDRLAYLKRVPLARAGTPADVASLVHFLATEGNYITGQTIRLDGGRSLM